ncbi:FliM/FliN family flagellar motor switch protein [Simkania negevensis]|uniref:FliM/FliN family flagellar motor switch protein n=1 Tax=Simkania negevensis TaxID=83561 RepID=A0ABS3ASK8_9BACT|nr:FliM/FliN family flagellar motor switch protein [Simkania negevensis]
MAEKESAKLQILRSLRGTVLSVDAILLEKTMEIRELAEINLGTVIQFDIPVTEPVFLSVNGTKIARGTVVQSGDHYGLELKKMLS